MTPFSATCPVCQTTTDFEVRSRNNVVCGGCRFIGDAIELFAAVTKQPLVGAVSQLVIEGDLSFEDDAEKRRYLTDRETNRRNIKVWTDGAEWLADEFGSTVQTLFQELHCHYHQLDPERVSPWLGTFSKEMLEELADGAPAIKRYRVLGLPCWSESTLAGLWLIHPRAIARGYQYFSIAAVDQALGLGHLTRAQDEVVFATNDPRVAIRYMVRQMWEGTSRDRLTPFVVPAPEADRSVPYTGARQVTFLPNDLTLDDNAPWLKGALGTLEAQMVLTWRLRERLTEVYPGTTVASIMSALKHQAVPVAQGVGSYLLSLPVADARATAHNLELSIVARSAVQSAFSGTDGETLALLFGGTARPKQIDFNGKRVQETKDGWFVKDLCISSVVVRITSVETDKSTGKTLVQGTLSAGSRMAAFTEDMTTLKKDFGNWLSTKAFTELSAWPTLDRNWSRHLLNLAYEFSRDTAKITTSEHPFGWSGNVLKFPRFLVDAKGVQPIQCAVSGPDLLPAKLTPSEYEALRGPGFCLVSLALLGNLCRTQMGLHAYGLVVPSSPHVVTRVADAFAMRTHKDLAIPGVMNAENQPLPHFGLWSDEKLAALLAVRGPKNIFTTVDAKTFRLLAIQPGWVRLNVENLPAYNELNWIFHALNQLIATPPETNGRFYMGIYQVLKPWLAQVEPRHAMVEAAAELDSSVIPAELELAGGNVVMLLRQLYDTGFLQLENRGTDVIFKHADVQAACASPVLPPLDLAAATRALTESRMLLRNTGGAWTISETIWDLMGSYRKTQR